jgi:MoaA/NifB/PqqE/SkfB family radical SAM enzyme
MHNQKAYLKNKQYNQQEIAQAKIILGSRARRLVVVLTSKCNLDCIMCERGTRNFTLPKTVVEQIVEFFPYLDSIMWQGGEVFLVDYFKEFFLKAARYKNLIQEINTNGLLITPEWAEILTKANVRLILSIDSTDKYIYEYIRKKAKFETLIQNLILLKEARIRFDKKGAVNVINVVVMRSNYQALDTFVDFALKYGFSSINFMYMVGGNCPQENIFDPLDNKVIAYLKKSIPKIIVKSNASGINVNCQFAEYLIETKVPVGDNASSVCLSALFCSMPWRSLSIDGARGGKVYPERLCLKPVGELSKNTLKEIWNNEKMQLYRKRITRGELVNWCNPNCIKGIVNKNFLRDL